MSLGKEYFDGVYADGPDPWGFADRWYEARKRQVLLAALPRPRFGDAFEPGCSTGELTVALAARCGSVLAMEVAQRPLAVAADRTADLGNVRVTPGAVPADWPPHARFDLVVLSEIGYYLDETDLDRTLGLAAASLADGGVLVTCHWRHRAPDYPLSGDGVHRRLTVVAARTNLPCLVAHVEEDFVLHVHGTPGAVSVARAGGLV